MASPVLDGMREPSVRWLPQQVSISAFGTAHAEVWRSEPRTSFRHRENGALTEPFTTLWKA